MTAAVRHEDSIDTRIFFIYESNEDDEGDPLECILYFSPKEFTIDLQVQITGSVMGMSDFLELISGNQAALLIKMNRLKFTILKLGFYSIVLGARTDVSDREIRQQLYNAYRLFLLYHGDFELYCEEQKKRDPSKTLLRESFDEIWTLYLPHAFSYYDKLCDSFNKLCASFSVVPTIELPKYNAASLYLRAAHILQSSQHRPGVIAGCLIYKRCVLYTQLSTNLTWKLMIMRPHQAVKFPGTPIKLEFDAKASLLYTIHLSRKEWKQLEPSYSDRQQQYRYHRTSQFYHSPEGGSAAATAGSGNESLDESDTEERSHKGSDIQISSSATNSDVDDDTSDIAGAVDDSLSSLTFAGGTSEQDDPPPAHRRTGADMVNKRDTLDFLSSGTPVAGGSAAEVEDTGEIPESSDIPDHISEGGVSQSCSDSDDHEEYQAAASALLAASNDSLSDSEGKSSAVQHVRPSTLAAARAKKKKAAAQAGGKSSVYSPGTRVKLKEYTLYTQRHLSSKGYSDLVMQLILDPTVSDNTELISALWKTGSILMADLERDIKNCYMTYQKFGQTVLDGSYYFLTYDQQQRALRGYPIKSWYAREKSFHDIVMDIHEDFETYPNMERITVSKPEGIVHGHQSQQREVYFSQRGGVGAPNDASSPLVTQYPVPTSGTSPTHSPPPPSQQTGNPPAAPLTASDIQAAGLSIGLPMQHGSFASMERVAAATLSHEHNVHLI